MRNILKVKWMTMMRETGQDKTNNDVYSRFYVKKRLLLKFAEIRGCKNVVCSRTS
jgi:hypothetical protein